MRLGMIGFSGFGGAGIVASEIADGLARRGHEVHYISDAVPPRLVSNTTVTCHTYPTSPDPLLPAVHVLAELMQSRRLDLVHAHFAIFNLGAALLARSLSGRFLPVVLTLHGSDVYGIRPRSATAHALRRALEACQAVCAVGPFLAREVHTCIGGGLDLRVVPNFVPDRYRRQDPPARIRRPGEIVLLHVSCFTPVKGVLDLVRAFALVRERSPARLVLVGDGPVRREAEVLAQSMGLAPYIRFTGFQRDLAPFFLDADLFLLPSYMESFGLAALEALAHGLPVIASQVGGLPALIRDGVDGLLVPPGRPEVLAEATLTLLGEPSGLARMAEQAREGAWSRFPSGLALDAYEDLYRSCLSTGD